MLDTWERVNVAVRPTYIELCAGIGGISIALERCGLVPVCRVEREAYAAAVLVARMEDSSLGKAPLWDDLTTFDGKPWRGGVDLVAAGFPCQPFSVAGKRLGQADERAIWPEIARIIAEVDPAAVFLENVNLDAFRRPFGDLRDMGFVLLPPCEVRASDVGAPHRRQRFFVLAYRASDSSESTLGRISIARRYGDALADSRRSGDERRREPGDIREAPAVFETRSDERQRGWNTARDEGAAVGDAIGARLEERRPKPEPGSFPAAWPPGPRDGDGWQRWIAAGGPEPCIRRGVDGLPSRVDELRCLGNAVVPECAEVAFRSLWNAAMSTTP